jgi:hypothetical protein
MVREAGRSPFLQGELHHLAGVHAGAIQGTAEQIDALYDPMPLIDQNESENLVVQVTETGR